MAYASCTIVQNIIIHNNFKNHWITTVVGMFIIHRHKHDSEKCGYTTYSYLLIWFDQHGCSINLPPHCIFHGPRRNPVIRLPRTIEIGTVTSIKPPASEKLCCTVSKILVIIDIECTKLHSCSLKISIIPYQTIVWRNK